MDKKGMPAVRILLSEALSAFKSSFGSVFLLFLLSFVFGFILFLVVFLGIIGVSVFSAVEMGGSQLEMWQSLQNFLTPGRLMQMGVGLGLLTIIGWIISSVVRLGVIVAIGRHKDKPSFGELIKAGFKFLIPATVVGFVGQLLVLGGTVLLIVPGILIWLFFQFTVYEMVLGGKKWFSALKGSVRIMGQHFGEVLVRMLVLWLGMLILFYLPIYLLDLLVSSLMSSAPAQAAAVAMILAMVRMIVGIMLAFYSMAYGVVMYQQAKSVTDEDRKVGMAWIWVLGFLGLALGSLASIQLVKVAKAPFEEMVSGDRLSDGGWMEGIVEKSEQEKMGDWKLAMKPEARVLYDQSQEIFEQMKDADQLAKVKKLNDENITLLKKAVDIDAGNPEIWASLSDAYTWVNSKGTIKDALWASKKAEELDPTIWGYANRTAGILLTMGKNEEAILKFQEVIRVEDGYGRAHLYLGVAYKRIGVKDQAKVELQRAIDIFTQYNDDGSLDEDILYARKEMIGL